MRYSFLLFLLVLVGCVNQNDNAKNTSQTQVNESVNSLNKIWNGYRFSSTEVRQFSEMIEQTLVDYISQFPSHSIDDVNQSLSFLIKKSETDSLFFAFTKQKLTDYLYHPNSPMRNDLYFENVLRQYQNSALLPEVEKNRDKVILDLVGKNQVGSTAANFEFETASGGKKDLNSFKTPLRLIVFYDPNCQHCKEVIGAMRDSDILNAAIELNKIVVLAIDPLGNRVEWVKYHEKIPKNWINGFDYSQMIFGNVLYNIQAYPTIYLIDDMGKVVLKDVYFSDVEKYLSENK